jgi:hypothetical protein
MDNFSLFNMYTEINFLLRNLLENENKKLENLEQITFSMIQNGVPIRRIQHRRRRIILEIRSLTNKIENNINNLVIVENPIDPLLPTMLLRDPLYRNQLQLLEMINTIIQAKEKIIIYKINKIAEIENFLSLEPVYENVNYDRGLLFINLIGTLQMEIHVLREENEAYQLKFEDIFCS